MATTHQLFITASPKTRLSDSVLRAKLYNSIKTLCAPFTALSNAICSHTRENNKTSEALHLTVRLFRIKLTND